MSEELYEKIQRNMSVLHEKYEELRHKIEAHEKKGHLKQDEPFTLLKRFSSWQNKILLGMPIFFSIVCFLVISQIYVDLLPSNSGVPVLDLFDKVCIVVGGLYLAYDLLNDSKGILLWITQFLVCGTDGAIPFICIDLIILVFFHKHCIPSSQMTCLDVINFNITLDSIMFQLILLGTLVAGFNGLLIGMHSHFNKLKLGQQFFINIAISWLFWIPALLLLFGVNTGNMNSTNGHHHFGVMGRMLLLMLNHSQYGVHNVINKENSVATLGIFSVVLGIITGIGLIIGHVALEEKLPTPTGSDNDSVSRTSIGISSFVRKVRPFMSRSGVKKGCYFGILLLLLLNLFTLFYLDSRELQAGIALSLLIGILCILTSVITGAIAQYVFDTNEKLPGKALGIFGLVLVLVGSAIDFAQPLINLLNIFGK